MTLKKICINYRYNHNLGIFMISKLIKITLTQVTYVFLIDKNLFLNFIYAKKANISRVVILSFF